MKDIVLAGAGGHALCVIESILSMGEYHIAGITDPKAKAGDSVLGCPVLGGDAVLDNLFSRGVHYAFVAVGSTGDCSVRIKLYNLLKKAGFIMPAVIDASAHISSNAVIAEGAYIGKNACINAKADIGAMAIVNTGAIVEHCCKIGAFSHISPGAVLCGDVEIGPYTHIGANSTVRNGLTVGEHSLIGSGSNVVENMPDNITAYGNPCRRVRYHE